MSKLGVRAFTRRTRVGAACVALFTGMGCGSNSDSGGGSAGGAGAVGVAGTGGVAATGAAPDTGTGIAGVGGTSSEQPATPAGASGAPGSAGASSAAAAGSSGVTPSGVTPSAGSDAGGGSGGAAAVLHLPWDWSGVVGTGQSLAVGDPGAARNTPDAAPRATTQPYQNLQLFTGSAAWPVDPNDAALRMIPLTEPIGRLAPTYPSSWPTNIAGETPHTAMGNQTVALAAVSGGLQRRRAGDHRADGAAHPHRLAAELRQRSLRVDPRSVEDRRGLPSGRGLLEAEVSVSVLVGRDPHAGRRLRAARGKIRAGLLRAGRVAARLAAPAAHGRGARWARGQRTLPRARAPAGLGTGLPAPAPDRAHRVERGSGLRAARRWDAHSYRVGGDRRKQRAHHRSSGPAAE